jgi:hypothetical protein
MSISLHYTDSLAVVQTLALPHDLALKGEFTEDLKKAEYTQSLSGHLIIENSVKVAGNKLTLSGNQSRGWINKTEMLAIRSFLDYISPMVLTVNNDTFDVIIDRSTAMEFTELFERSETSADTIYFTTIHFIRV